MIDLLATRYAYLLFAFLVATGLYTAIASPNLVKKVVGINMFQTGIFLFFVATAYVEVDGEPGQSPVGTTAGVDGGLYASPLPHVIVLTAIVVGVALTAVALALVVRIYSAYGTLDEETLKEVQANE